MSRRRIRNTNQPKKPDTSKQEAVSYNRMKKYSDLLRLVRSPIYTKEGLARLTTKFTNGE